MRCGKGIGMWERFGKCERKKRKQQGYARSVQRREWNERRQDAGGGEYVREVERLRKEWSVRLTEEIRVVVS